QACLVPWIGVANRTPSPKSTRQRVPSPHRPFGRCSEEGRLSCCEFLLGEEFFKATKKVLTTCDREWTLIRIVGRLPRVGGAGALAYWGTATQRCSSLIAHRSSLIAHRSSPGHCSKEPPRTFLRLPNFKPVDPAGSEERLRSSAEVRSRLGSVL